MTGNHVGLTPQKEGFMDVGQVGLAIMGWLLIIMLVSVVLTVVVTQWE